MEKNTVRGEALNMMPWWWNNWDRVVVTGVVTIFALYCLGRITNDIRAMREMTEELVKYTRWRSGGGGR